MAAARQAVEQLLRTADIEINGARPWDVRVHDERFFARALAGGTLGFGEAYMDGWWDCEALDEMSCRAVHARLEERFAWTPQNLFAFALSLLSNRQSRRRAREVGRKHYDLGNDFFEAMLDPWMQYSCALFEQGDDLAAAQRRKLDMICQRLELRPGLRLLDIGCGWGGLAKYSVENCGCAVVGLTISRAQQEYAVCWCDGLDIKVELRDYREVRGTYDRAISVGMIEHVGFKNYRTYFEKIAQSLGRDGLFLCQGIGNPVSVWQLDPWIRRYIFPNSILPSLARLTKAAEGLFLIEDVRNIGSSYDPTLMAWCANFERAWPRFAARYDEQFHRMWRYYLLTCAGAFRARSLQVYSVLCRRVP
ncbi:MAG TPA: cyclopropane fatty acyl phospholipid synthase, partial [Chthoniobacterales bacterium]